MFISKDITFPPFTLTVHFLGLLKQEKTADPVLL